MPKRTTAPVEIVVFNGITFRRYPCSKHWADRTYFVSGSVHRKHGVGHLHREVWKATHGPIPAGHEIHHVDGNASNNDPGNLACIPAAEHTRHHSSLYTEAEREERRRWFARIRPLSVNWHGTEEGRRWHRKHAYEVAAARVRSEFTCKQCGRSYLAFASAANRFCSNNCKSAFRRRSGVDDVVVACRECGGEFKRNRYAATRYCSRSCAQRARIKAARGRL